MTVRELIDDLQNSISAGKITENTLVMHQSEYSDVFYDCLPILRTDDDTVDGPPIIIVDFE